MKEIYSYAQPVLKLPNAYGKPMPNALIIRHGEKVVALQSYDTVVLVYDYEKCRVCRVWNGYSATTMRHINAFMQNIGFPQFNGKKWYTSLPFCEWKSL